MASVPNRLYLAGPMSGRPLQNFPAFHSAASRLRDRGFDVVNPAELDGGHAGESWESCMRRDLPFLIGCQGVALLPGWKSSRGATLEVAVAKALGMPIFDALSLARLDLLAANVVSDDPSDIEAPEAIIRDLREGAFDAGDDDDDAGHPADEPEDDEPVTATAEAERLVYGDRERAYGHPFDDFSRTAKIWEAVLGHPVEPEQVALCMVGLKISREVNKPGRDNRVDGIGYFACLDRVVRRRAELEDEASERIAAELAAMTIECRQATT